MNLNILVEGQWIDDALSTLNNFQPSFKWTADKKINIQSVELNFILDKSLIQVCVVVQPYAHTGIYSEGEFAISPSIVQLAAERKLPMERDWDSTILGKDQGERLGCF